MENVSVLTGSSDNEAQLICKWSAGWQKYKKKQFLGKSNFLKRKIAGYSAPDRCSKSSEYTEHLFSFVIVQKTVTFLLTSMSHSCFAMISYYINELMCVDSISEQKNQVDREDSSRKHLN